MIGILAVALSSILHAMAEDCVTTGLMLWNAMVHARAHAVQTVALAVIAFIYVNREPLGILGKCTCRGRTFLGDADTWAIESLTQHREFLRIHRRIQMLEERLQQHLFYDGTGLRDFASVMSGGRVVPELTSETCTIKQSGKTPWYKPWGWRGGPSPTPLVGLPPEFAIYPDTRVGNCWPMKGHSGSLGLSLARPTVVTSFTVDHVPKSMAFRFQCAPRSGELWGLLEEGSQLGSGENLTVTDASKVLLPQTPRVRGSRYARSPLVSLGTFDFDIHAGRPFQTYNISDNVLAQLGNTQFGVVVFNIRENWGDDDLTCLYRLRVHSDDTIAL